MIFEIPQLSTVSVAKPLRPFVASELFLPERVHDESYCYSFGPAFIEAFLGKDGIQENIEHIELFDYFDLPCTTFDVNIFRHVKPLMNIQTSLWAIYFLTSRQKKGESGTLLVSGFVNTFYISPYAVSVEYCNWTNNTRRWHLGVTPMATGSYMRDKDRRVFMLHGALK